MSNFFVEKTPIEGLLIIKSKVYKDNRGFFMEIYKENDFIDMGIKERFVQDNRSVSTRGTLRGLHFQKTRPQGKLVNVTHGEVFDVAVDLRRSSNTFGRWYGIRLNSESGDLFYIPPGFAHGFLVISETAGFIYKCTDVYFPDDEGGLMWNDPAVGIDWPTLDEDEIVMSEKDTKYPGLDRCFVFK